MGKRYRGKRKGGGGNTWADYRPKSDYVNPEKNNKLFEAYYNGLPIVPEEDLDTFWKVMKTELPNSFRFTGSKGHALAVQQRLIDHYIPQISAVKYNGELVEPPHQVPWYPEKLAWSMTTPKNIIRKFSPFSSFQKFLVSETSVGNISRQEIVSMIPPLLIDIKPGMTVLDMCAAPGSKSAQLIEMVHGGEEARIRKVVHEHEKQQKEGSPDGIEVQHEQSELEKDGDWSDDGRSTGLLIANDSEYRRAQMLVHQVKRLNSPNLIVTNHDASIFPSIRIPSTNSNTARYLKFDRILADVPCTGDGTARKNPGIWKDWVPSTGMGLHNLQVRILVRALQMLKVGGRVVYSTCSLNPVENEAVVASAIEACGGLENVQIVDCKNELPGLKRVSGLKTWKLMDKQERFWSSWEELEAAKSDPGTDHRDFLSKFTEGMFPRKAVNEAEELPLDRCIRVYPHLQDTGGFFITVLEKTSEIRANTADLKKRKASTIVPKEADAVSGENGIQNGTKVLSEDFDDGVFEGLDDDTKMENDVKTEEITLEEDVKAEEDVKTEADIKEDKIVEDTKMEGTFKENEITEPTKRKRTDEEIPESPTKKLKIEFAESSSQGVPHQNGSAMKQELETDRDKMTFKPKTNQPHEEPFKYLDPDHPTLRTIYDFYQISPRFPRDRYMVRNATGEPVKAIYYTSKLIRDIMILNEGKGIKFVQAGVKMFMRQDAQGQDICRWRVQSEGISILEAWVGEDRILRLFKREPLRKLLLEMFIKIGSEGWQSLGPIGDEIAEISMGCCLLRIEPSDTEGGFKERLVIPLWRSIASANIMLPKEERKAMLLRLYNDDSPLIDHSQHKKVKEQEAQSGAAETPKMELDPETQSSIIGKDASADGDGILDKEKEALNEETENVETEPETREEAPELEQLPTETDV